jgi:hypothetical protein
MEVPRNEFDRSKKSETELFSMSRGADPATETPENTAKTEEPRIARAKTEEAPMTATELTSVALESLPLQRITALSLTSTEPLLTSQVIGIGIAFRNEIESEARSGNGALKEVRRAEIYKVLKRRPGGS